MQLLQSRLYLKYITSCLILLTPFTQYSKLYCQQMKAKLMVLGSYHMANPGADVFNMQVDDVLSPHRQKEMEDLVGLLIKFKPTKLVLEVNSKADSSYNELYKSYLSGQYVLTNNETQQLGFRLAKYSGHKKVYCVDETGKFDFNSVMEFAMQNGQGQMVQKMIGTIQQYIADEGKLLLESSLIEFFKHMNTPENHDKGLDWYMKLLEIANGDSFPGPELVADVYERNLKIMSNIYRISESNEDRILVIYGNGHTAFFKSILMGSEKFEWVDVHKFLSEK